MKWEIRICLYQTEFLRLCTLQDPFILDSLNTRGSVKIAKNNIEKIFYNSINSSTDIYPFDSVTHHYCTVLICFQSKVVYNGSHFVLIYLTKLSFALRKVSSIFTR